MRWSCRQWTWWWMGRAWDRNPLPPGSSGVLAHMTYRGPSSEERRRFGASKSRSLIHIGCTLVPPHWNISKRNPRMEASIAQGVVASSSSTNGAPSPWANKYRGVSCATLDVYLSIPMLTSTLGDSRRPRPTSRALNLTLQPNLFSSHLSVRARLHPPHRHRPGA